MMFVSKAAPRSVVEWPESHEPLSRRFGIDAPKLMESMASSFSIVASRRTLLDVPQTRGAARYNAAAVGAREVLLPSGYEITDDLPRVMRSLSRELAVALYFGDEATGIATASPSNAYAKGESMSELVGQNQSLLFPGLPLSFRPANESTRATTGDSELPVWVLLVRADGSRLRAEFSLPSAEDGRGYIDAWKERLLLPETDLPLISNLLELESPLSAVPSFDIPVKPR